MSRLFWVRHGPTHARSMVGWSDIPADLSDTARLKRLSEYLPRGAPVISSDLSRAVATADAIAGPRRRLPHDQDLREINFGEWELLPFDTVPDQPRLRSFWDQPGEIRPPGGESWHDICARTGRAVERLLGAHWGPDIIVVSHMGTILTQVQQALSIPAYDAFGHRIDNLSVTELHLRDGAWTARAINHLP
ncbi:histidine phosphatase family protein [Roseovarius salis]|uniref:histidine phosphatase family protein n=1 Tax=Roseovarius salis TaxID=3376063 RepID=UPI0037CA086A